MKVVHLIVDTIYMDMNENEKLLKWIWGYRKVYTCGGAHLLPTDEWGTFILTRWGIKNIKPPAQGKD